MTPDDFRRLALSFPETSEVSHMGHPDFRVGGKIFATLGYPDDDHGVVILPSDEQMKFVAEHQNIFTPAKGAWGASGATQIRLERVGSTALRSALALAYRKRATKPASKRRTNES